MDAPGDSAIGGTYVGNPVACAAALAVLDEIDRRDLCGRARAIGETMRRRLREPAGARAADRRRARSRRDARHRVRARRRDARARHPSSPPASSSSRCSAGSCCSAGLHGNVIRNLAPLVISDAELDEALDVLEGAIEDAVAAVTAERDPRAGSEREPVGLRRIRVENAGSGRTDLRYARGPPRLARMRRRTLAAVPARRLRRVRRGERGGGAAAQPARASRARCCRRSTGARRRRPRAAARRPALTNAATWQSQVLAPRRQARPHRPDGSTLFDRLAREGFHGAHGRRGSGGRDGPGGAVAAWLASPGHRENLLAPPFRSASASSWARSEGMSAPFVTADFAAERPPRPPRRGGSTRAQGARPLKGSTRAAR